jgi:DNA-binding CsgD family transcriptional regulator
MDKQITALQTQVLRLLGEGARDKQIAKALALTKHAVDYHMRALRRHFRVTTRVELAIAAAAAEHDRLRDLNVELVAALKGVIRVADRATDEFDAARAAIAKAEA